MGYTRRKTLFLVGGGVVVAAAGATAYSVSRQPSSALKPWEMAGDYTEIRRKALSFALLAPNPHNRQPWLVQLIGEDEVVLYADRQRLLPQTDPYSRQITIGLGGFLELMRMAAAEDGYRVDLTLFPDGEDQTVLDGRPIARGIFHADPGMPRDPLFSSVLSRRSLKEPYDTNKPVEAALLQTLAASAVSGSRFGGSVSTEDIASYRDLTREALRIELETPRTYRESVDVFRIGFREVDANPDGIDFTGPLFETLALLGLFSRETALDPSSSAYTAGVEAVYANADTAMGHVWLVTGTNSRRDQIAAGADWLRVNLAATSLGLGTQPLSQALQEYPEMSVLRMNVHSRLAPEGGTVQMLARIGYGPDVPPSPRWPLEAKIVRD
jgi:hypothetical protein